jgi:hypothetical protein
MSALEFEGYILTGVLVISFLIKAAKWTIEELSELILAFKKFKTTIKEPREELNASPAPSQQRSLSERIDSKAA